MIGETGNYLYGIVRSGTKIPQGLLGIDDFAPVCAWDCGRLVALTSEVASADFVSDLASDPAWVVPRALRHEVVVEKMLALGPILPVRFGALFSTREALGAWVTRNEAAIIRFLDDVADKEEWTVKVHIELDKALETLIEHDPAWSEKARSLPAAAGARYFQEKKLRQEARLALRGRARVATEQLRRAARALADERVLAPRNPGEPDVEQIAHLAYLVPRGTVSRFLVDLRAPDLDSCCHKLVTSGPWPPAHFCPSLF